MAQFIAYSPDDAAVILSWVSDEDAFYKWSAGRFGAWPPSPSAMNDRYAVDGAVFLTPLPDDLLQGARRFTGYGRKPPHKAEDDEKPLFLPLVYEEDGVPAGHLILRQRAEGEMRLGFIIVDGARRGTGLGRRMVRGALAKAFREFGAKRVTLGVFTDNPPARRCYLAAGFAPCDPPVTEEYTFPNGSKLCEELEITKERFEAHAEG